MFVSNFVVSKKQRVLIKKKDHATTASGGISSKQALLRMTITRNRVRTASGLRASFVIVDKKGVKEKRHKNSRKKMLKSE